MTGETHSLRRGIRWSLFVHGAAFLILLLRSLIFPSEPIRVTPTLRVDLVALPDVLKKDLKAPSAPETETSDENSSKAPKRTVVDDVDPDQMVIKKTDTSKAREKKLKSTLAKMKALAKINAESEAPPLLKGNKISKGSSISGDAKESAEENYYDRVRNRLQDHWALPVWLGRRSLSARVRITLDSRGRVIGVLFVQSSGNPQFDENVRKTIQESQPLPFPPREVLSTLSGTHSIMVGFPL